MSLEDQLLKLYPNAKRDYISAITSARGQALLSHCGLLDAPIRLCHFIAQCAHESGGFRITHESGNYSAKRLLEIFPKYFHRDNVNRYVGRPEAILSRAYASRLGNGDEASGDGWRFRGRGYLQETGRDNYRLRSEAAGVDLVVNPDLAAEPNTSLRIALDRWSKSKLNSFADQGSGLEAVLAISRGINYGNPTSLGRPNGLRDREIQFAAIWPVLKDFEFALGAPAIA